jgi:hypothetical protein
LITLIGNYFNSNGELQITIREKNIIRKKTRCCTLRRAKNTPTRSFVYRTSTSCLQCDLEFFMFAVIKTFVTDISASTGRNDFIFTKIFITANMKNSKSCGKQEVDVR